jgi:rhamnogalacturonan hydrolase
MKLSNLATAATIMAMASRALSQLVEGTPVGPQTPLSAKAGTVCNVLNYGGAADGKTDVGAAINRAFKECVLRAGSNGSTLYVPPGQYSSMDPLGSGVRRGWNHG